ncbi:alpha/beta hydrolase [Zobellella endophytica]|uniref:Alpha/beta hydrolase n=1 Tax=Zobellella endophytica TaxID=2116700 RepID=A0A2P7RBL5_9GAMM|nr:alpha/beta fold hydrolase [Zobellella endophytica]PSJ47552.1 alpha/beta hydrolase [Zobellella endophytica]
MHRSWQFGHQGRRLAVMEWGDPRGVPLVALHGWLDNAASFTLLARLLPEVRLIAIDLAGHGLSDHRPAGQPYYIWDNVAEVQALLDTLGLARVALLGHSMGAGVASLFAGAFPERVSQLFLLDGLAPLDYPADELPAQMAQALLKSGRLQRRALRPYASVEQAVRARMGGRWPVSREAATWLLARGLREEAGGWYWRSDLALTQPSVVRLCEAQIAAFLRRLTMPVLLVMAESGIGLARVEPLSGLVPQLELKLLAGGHHLHLEAVPAARIARWIGERLQA